MLQNVIICIAEVAGMYVQSYLLNTEFYF